MLKEQIVTVARNAEAPQRADACIHQLFEAQAAQTPQAVAVCYEAESLTYGELNGRANRLARHLRAVGVGADAPVGILMERSLDMIVGLLAVLKAGGAYLPLDPAYPRERLTFMLEDAGAKVLLTQRRVIDAVGAQAGVRTVTVDTEWTHISRQASENTDGPVVTAENLAYIIYTSGSTGRPKGVLIPHRAVVSHNFAIASRYALGRQDRVLQFASISFDVAVEEIFPTWARGGTVVLRPDRALSSPSAFIEFLGEQRISVVNLTTPYWNELIVELVRSGRMMPECLRLAAIGGEKGLPDKFALSKQVMGDGFQLLNVYGPTETTVTNTSFEFHKGDEQHLEGSVPLGLPLANSRLHILDEDLRPRPVGESGEVYIGGECQARGYHRRPDLTAERFIPDPFGGEPGARLYRTGDVAFMRADGQIEFVGRADEQVKIRGFRVELGEIEAALLRHAEVREAVVLAREDEPGMKRLVAYVVAGAGEQRPAGGELRAFLKSGLPDYMLPSAYVFLDALPLTQNKKVDRRALPPPADERPELSEAYVAPRNAVEEVVAGIWAEVLRVASIGVNDNFFELGGDSLRAMQIISRIRDTFKVELPLLSIFDADTVAGLAASIEGSGEVRRGLSLPPLEAVPRTGQPLPASFPQQAVWFLSQLGSEVIAYNTQLSLRFLGALDVPALERALSEIVRRHEIFRTTFAEADGQIVQTIHEPWAVKVPIIDLRDVADEREREAEAERLIQEECLRPFEITSYPLIRWTLVRLADDDFALAQVEQHFVHDGWSLTLLLHEIKELYAAFASGRPSPFPELPVQFADYALWQRRWMQGETLDAHLAYWREKLAGMPPLLELPTDRPRPKIQSFRGSAQKVVLTAELSKALRALSRREGVTLFMTMLAAFKVLLQRYTGQPDVFVGSGVANRPLREMESLIGMFVNAVVLRTDLAGDPTFEQLLRRVRQVTLEAYAYQGLPFDRLVEDLRPKRDMSVNPLFQVMFSFHDSQMPDMVFPNLKTTLLYRYNDSAQFDLDLIVIPNYEQHSGLSYTPGEERLLVEWRYSTDLFDDATIERMMRHYENALAGIVAGPARPISELPLLTGAEEQQLFFEWQNEGTTDASGACAHALFETQAQRTPGAVAVAFGDERLTYAELNARANRLAHHLRALGVVPETLVGVYLNRSLDVPVALLAVLKAGGTYLPLDPAYPRERVAFMLEDSGAAVIVTREHLVESLPPQHRARVVCLDAEKIEIERAPENSPDGGAGAENLAYVIYTSGSTGKPKGSMISHASLSGYMLELGARLSLDPADRFLQFAPLSFDVLVEELFPAWACGAAVVMQDEALLTSPSTFTGVLERERITCCELPTAFWHEWVKELDARGSALPASLRLVIIGGENALPEAVKSWQRHSAQLVNVYGLTETTVTNTTYFLPPADAAANSLPAQLPIGRPVGQTRIYVLDRYLQPVPVGVVGEIYIGGGCLARGYKGRPELTAERFIPNPFGGEAGARLYRTGDAARYRPDGQIEFVGRLDHQVKVRGFRIELGEIEAALERHEEVRASIVVVREDEPGDKRLVAYVVSDGDSWPGVPALRQYLRERLPEYMLPSVFVRLDELPLTPNGKVDRRALPAPEQSRAEAGREYVAPRNVVEEVLAGVWAEVLGVERVGVEDDFFELGGHSLLAVRVASRLRDALQVELPLPVLFQAPTVAALAEVVMQDAGERERVEATARLLMQISRLSEDEIETMI